MCKSLENIEDIHICGYLVSNRYDNPSVIYGKRVYKIEEENPHFSCINLAVNGDLLWKVRDELLKYNIDKLILISPLMVDEFRYPASVVVSNKCNISKKTCIAEDVQIVTDETSSIIIEDNVIIGKGCIILATDNSKIYIGEKSCIYSDTSITVDHNSEIVFGKYNDIRKNTYIDSRSNSEIKLSDNVFVGNMAGISSKGGSILIGKNTSFQACLYMESEKSKIIIGNDCMFSYYVKMNVGSHRLMNIIDNTNITNTLPIKIGNHVWCGMNACILPGCNVGDGSVIGAASLVNKSIKSNCTCAGIPAKVLRNEVEWFRK